MHGAMLYHQFSFSPGNVCMGLNYELTAQTETLEFKIFNMKHNSNEFLKIFYLLAILSDDCASDRFH